MTDADERRTMKEIDHTHPHDDRSAGDLFLRGPVVVADGGERNTVSRSSSERDSDGGERERSERDPHRSVERSDGGDRDAEETEAEPATERMKDVDHTPPHDEEGATRVFERGEEFEVAEE